MCDEFEPLSRPPHGREDGDTIRLAALMASGVVHDFGNLMQVISSSIRLHLFLSQAFQRMGYGDLFPSIIKTFFFGFIVGLIGCYKGYTSNSGTRGVGVAANTAVVLSSILIFLVDLLAVQITNLLGLY